MILNHATLSAVFTGYSMAYAIGFRSLTPEWMQIATLIPSSSSSNQYQWMGGFPRLREWVGDRHIKSIRAYKYALENKEFEGTVSVPKAHIEDDSFGVYSPLFQEMGYAAAVHPDELLYSLILSGTSVACYDGQPFFDANHPKLDGSATVQSNYQGGSGDFWCLLDLRRPLKPFVYQKRSEYNLQGKTAPSDDNVFFDRELLYGVDGRCNVGFAFWQMAYGSKQTLNATNYNAAFEAMMLLSNDEGRNLGIRPTHLLHGPGNRSEALTLLAAERLSNGESNINRGTVTPILTSYMP